MFDEEKLKNDQLKHKNDEGLGFEDLIEGGFDETDDRYPRAKLSLSDNNIGCGAFVGAAMQYPFDGKEALTKVAIAAGLALIPFVGQLLVSGYGVRVVRRILRGQRDLPEWNDFGGDFMRGLVILFGGIVFGFLMMLSTIAIVTIPIVTILGFPMVAYAICRYAATDDISAFIDIIGAYRYVLSNIWTSFVMTLSCILLGISWGITIALTYILCYIVGSILLSITGIGIINSGEFLLTIPGLILSAAATISFTYMMGAWGRTVGLEG